MNLINEVPYIPIDPEGTFCKQSSREEETVTLKACDSHSRETVMAAATRVVSGLLQLAFFICFFSVGEC